MIRIRPEKAGEADSVRAIQLASFPTPTAARLVDRLRREGDMLFSLVGEADGELLGHALLTPVWLEPPLHEAAGASLAPLAVLPAYRGRQIGSRLVLAGLEACREAELGFVVVLGDPLYYARFGFRPASQFGLSSPWDGHTSFQALELKPACLRGHEGLVRYAPAFAEIGTPDTTAA